jgi:hypothetical protein
MRSGRRPALFEFDVVGSGYRWPLDHPAFDVMQQTWVSPADPEPADEHR